MAHITSKSYYNLQKRLDKAAQGAPNSETLYKILEILFTKKEAELVSQLPLNFFTIKEAAETWNKSRKSTKKILNRLADKGILLDLKKGKTQAYFLAPTMVGFFEFSLMRTNGKFDRKVLSELFYQYLNTEDGFLWQLFLQKPPVGRIYVHEDSIQKKHKAEVLSYERATHIIKTASCITVGTCYCRHKMEHLGKACNNPQDVCLTFNKSAESLAKHKIAKKISKKKALEILDKCESLGLVHFGDNIQEDVNFICNCCGCCCEALQTYKRFGYKSDMSTNFYSKHNPEKCNGCGICVKHCPVEAITLHKDKDGKLHANVDLERCIGCGVCVRFCPTKSFVLERKEKLKFVPKDTFERLILEAIDSGKLQNYIFDNQNLLTHAILRRFLGVIISLSPTKILMANQQLRSRFIRKVAKTKYYALFDKLFNKRKKPDYSHPEMEENKNKK